VYLIQLLLSVYSAVVHVLCTQPTRQIQEHEHLAIITWLRVRGSCTLTGGSCFCCVRCTDAAKIALVYTNTRKQTQRSNERLPNPQMHTGLHLMYTHGTLYWCDTAVSVCVSWTAHCCLSTFFCSRCTPSSGAHVCHRADTDQSLKSSLLSLVCVCVSNSAYMLLCSQQLSI
jgi:hypothetical protein